MSKEPILKVKDLGISFSQYTNGLVRGDLNVIRNLDIELYEGEILAVVGSSGSGKSLLAHAILGILPDNACTQGDMIYKGEILDEKRKEKLRGDEIVLIPQSVNYLDPLKKVGKQIKISIKDKDKKTQDEIVDNLFKKYNLEKKVKNYYPFQLSGGMARKVLLSTALASDSKVIIADEPTPGLDEESLNEVLKDFRDIADSGRAILMITHDIMAALKIADKVAIFYAGSTLEIANTSDFKQKEVELRHPYTKALYKALPNHDFVPIDDKTQPLPNELPKGCVFSDRCPLKDKNCENQVPKIREIRNGKVRCIHAT
ncbi:oligopeptide/dipeptide ABC transporter ATP-binding protein [Intestinibacter bartlettii]|uniref:oligopeptide/dipeptide ABC transporter ATP-binding protein n=1 Tax=Intestinibacter bartlettii TaxID=261299 RepID=UPI001D1013D6|nr:ABC transporter ATP-binding protein [Intestinibacter bartlettii]MCC2706584.1 ABC transporter ATP-binding protein [Intestinibacter bartlettii]MCC2762033.1 ABC transporter ATP-binding protein [Intestinibacter bartlettii]MDU6473203.1 ABC transporter ATP-binding protein [Intestinibacter bartlettii]